MDTLFLKILNMSITASWVVLAVILIRLLLQKAPKFIRIILWALVAVRLICPFSIESVFGLIPNDEPISLEPSFTDPFTNYNSIPVINPNISPNLENNTDIILSPVTITAADIWIIGMLILILCTAISYFRICKKVKEAVPIKDNIYLCDHIPTPFILGIIKPKIYLPSSIAEEDMEYVIAHENAHLKRYDHCLKPFGFLLLIIHWFNPFIWLSYILFCRDIELICDENVIQNIGIEKKKSYSNALINCSASSKILSACPLAFGEVGVKTRIKNVLNYKKPALYISITAIVACAVVAVCFLTNSDGIKINQITDDGGFDYLFKNVNSLKIVKYGYSINVEDVGTTLKYLKKVKLESTPISTSRAYDRDKSYQIVINDLTTLCFNQELNELWIKPAIKSSYSYTVKNPTIVQEIFKNTTNYSNSIKYAIAYNKNNPSKTGSIGFQLGTKDSHSTQIQAECTKGYMSGISIVSHAKEKGIDLIADADSPVCWHPEDNPEIGTDINFNVYKNEHIIDSGTLSIKFVSEKPLENDTSTSVVTYDIQLLNCENLYLQQGTEQHEGIIFITENSIT